MEILIITGLSGAGKTRTSDECEDMGYYCVDNLPAALTTRFAQLALAAGSRYDRVALVPYVNNTKDLEALHSAVSELASPDCTVRLLYLESDTDTIVRRYKESRRPHPFAKSGDSLRAAIAREQALLAPLRERADLILDTAGLSLNTLRARLSDFLHPETRRFTLNLMSFGYKHGLPQEADMILDARCLPNPYYIPEMRARTGLDAEVANYVFATEAARTYLLKLTDMLKTLVPMFGADRSEMTVAIGCTGGKHRSVAVTQALAEVLTAAGISTAVSHRELDSI